MLTPEKFGSWHHQFQFPQETEASLPNFPSRIAPNLGALPLSGIPPISWSCAKAQLNLKNGRGLIPGRNGPFT